ncbi:MAG: M10 family metallopeptidase [Cyanobium sp.]
MTTSTRDALDALLYVRNGDITARWNFPEAVGSPLDDPAGFGTAVSLTYSFPDTVTPYFTPPDFRAFSQQERQATREVLAAISSVVAVQFREVEGIGQMTYAMSSQSQGQEGFAFQPGYGYSFVGDKYTSVTESDRAGDVWINRQIERTDANLARGGDGFATLLHETSHAIGLKHPFEAPSDGFLLDGELDNERYTVMSYNAPDNTNIVTVSGDPLDYSFRWIPASPSTLMPLDIQALQALYGANTTTRRGNDTYRWSRHPEILETIYDTGGRDRIDCRNQSFRCFIDLRPGSFSSIAQRLTDAQKRIGLDLPSWFDAPLPRGTYDGRDNLAIAEGVTIEQAFGGSGADTIIGNQAANTLSGGLGRDRLTGGLGADRFLFDTAPSKANLDKVNDFSPGQDALLLDARRFPGLSGSRAGQPLAAELYRIGSAPLDRDDLILYNPSTNLLSYAPEGSASRTLLPIAQMALPGNQAPLIGDLLVLG